MHILPRTQECREFVSEPSAKVATCGNNNNRILRKLKRKNAVKQYLVPAIQEQRDTMLTLIVPISKRKRKTFKCLLTFYLNSRHLHPFIKGHVLGKFQLRYVLPNHLPQYLFGLPLPLLIPTQANPSHLLRIGSSVLLLFTCPEPSQSRHPHLILHGSHSHLFSNNLIPNLI